MSIDALGSPGSSVLVARFSSPLFVEMTAPQPFVVVSTCACKFLSSLAQTTLPIFTTPPCRLEALGFVLPTGDKSLTQTCSSERRIYGAEHQYMDIRGCHGYISEEYLQALYP